MQHHRVIQQLPNRLSSSLGRACCYWEDPAKVAQYVLHIRYMLALAPLLLHTVSREWPLPCCCCALSAGNGPRKPSPYQTRSQALT